MSDFYTDSARRRLDQLNAEAAALRADIEASRVNQDHDGAGAAIQSLADIEAQRQNLLSLHQQYVASQTPPAQPEVSDAERAARPPERMGWDDVVAMTRQSKYAKDIKPDDPDLLAGYREAMRRRQPGYGNR